MRDRTQMRRKDVRIERKKIDKEGRGEETEEEEG